MTKPITPIEFVCMPGEGFIRIKDLALFVPFSKTTIWRKAKAGLFPKPIKLSPCVTAWRVQDVREWIERTGKAA